MTAGTGLYGLTFRDGLKNTIALAIAADAIKLALVASGYTPDFNAHDFYSGGGADITNEVTGTGYTAGGNALTTLTFTTASSYDTFDSDDPSWTSATISGIRAGIGYDHTLTNDPLLWSIDLGSDYSVTAGTLTYQVNANGHWRIHLV